MALKYLNPLRILTGIARRAEALTARRATQKRRATASAWLHHTPIPLKVNIGCGKAPFEGWTNLDLDPESKADLLWDVTEGLPFSDDSCAFIYCEHFLEHISVQNGVQ